MTSVQQRQKLLGLIGKACADGARLQPACRQIGLSCRSARRWQRTEAAEGDQRPLGKRRYVYPPNKLREEERQAVVTTLNSEAFKDLPPSQIVHRLVTGIDAGTAQLGLARPGWAVSPRRATATSEACWSWGPGLCCSGPKARQTR